MTRTCCCLLFCLIVLVPAHAQATVTARLPAAANALVPSGAQVSSPTFSKSPAYMVVEFLAEKKLSGGHAASYQFHLLSYDTNALLWKIRAPIYQADTANKIHTKRASFGVASNPPVSYDSARETKYSWGSGFTQRVVHHYMGEGTGPDYIDYRAAYVGIIGGAMFELTVNGVRTADEADQWAKTVAAKASVLSLSNIGN